MMRTSMFLGWSALLLVACGGSTTPATVAHADAAGSGPPDAASRVDGASPDGERADEGTDGGGAAVRNAECTPTTEETGAVIDSDHGRLDGTLVYVVLVGEGEQCNGDESHVHLQIEVSGSIYDVAVDIGTAPSDEVGIYEESLAVPGGVWAEGWHATDTLAYPTLGVHSTSFTTVDPDTLGAQVATLLANVSKVSIFCKGYPQGNGCHDVHYEDGTGEDGAIVLNPTEATSEILFFHFSSQTF